MLSFLAFAMVATFMTLIMTKRLSAIVALILVPLIFALIAGALAGVDLGDLGGMMMQGVADLAPTGVMLVFGILFFGLMIDVGLFDPLIRSEEHTSELQSLMRISYAVFCLKKKKQSKK